MTTQELDRDIWRAFIRTYAARDADGFLDLYRPDLIRAGGPAAEVIGFAAYAAQTRQWFAELTGRGDGVAIDVRFTERLVQGDLASERGILRITTLPAAGDGQTFHGRFHTVARREGGRWRIAFDYDSNDATAEDFAAAAPVG